MNENWLLSLIIAVLLAMLALLGRAQQRSWLAPGAFFALVWSGFLLLALIGAPHYEVSVAAIAWIFASALAVYAGSLVGAHGLAMPVGQHGALPATRFHLPWLRGILILCILLGIGSSFVLLKSGGYSLTTLLSLDMLAQIGSAMSSARYQHLYTPSLLEQFLLVFVYASALFGGVLFVLRPSRFNRLLGLLSLVPALLIVLVQTTRAAMFIAGILWLASYLSAHVLLEGRAVRLFTRGHLRAVFLLAPLLFAGLTLPRLMFRRELTVLPVLSEMASSARADFLGPLSAFSRWFADWWYRYAAPGFGIYTVGGLSELLGLQPMAKTFYELPEVGGTSTTITTLFSGLIRDFTLPGSLAVFFATGVVTGWSYYRVVHGKKLYLPVLIAFYGIAMGSIFGSIFGYETVTAGLLVFAAYLLGSTLIYSGPGRKTVGTEGIYEEER